MISKEENIAVNFKRILWLFPLFGVLLTAASCGEIVEEEEETDETETIEVEQDTSDMEEDIDAQLILLASTYDTVTTAKPEGVNEYDFIDANPDAFDAIVAWGTDAVPYLCGIGEGYQTAFSNMRIAPEEYAKCILAYAAAQEIDSATFNRAYASPDGVHVLYRSPSVLWGMADSYQGILYDFFLADAQGTVLTEATGFSSLAYIDWTEDGRYAIVSDRLMEETLPAQTTVFDAERAQVIGLPGREVFDEIVAQYGEPYYTIDTRYLDSVRTDVLRIWLGLKMTDGQIITGYYDYDLTAGEMTALEYALFDADTGGAEIARELPSHEVGTSLAYLMSDTTVFRLEVEVKEGWERTLYINEVPALKDFLFLDDLRVVDDRYLAVVTGGTDVNSQHLYLFDGTGTLLFETFYLTDKGIIFNGIKAVEEDRILMYGGRGYHGPSLLVREQEQILAGEYTDYLYNDPIPDVIEGGEVTPDAFGEVLLYPNRASIDPDLNPDLVIQGVYALPYFGKGQFGQIVPVETVQTLGMLLDELYLMSEIAIPENLTVSETVDFCLDQLLTSANGFLGESDYIAQNPDAFDALVSLGTEALPYLTEISDTMPAMMAGTGESTVLCVRAALARMAAYRIDPTLYDMTLLSPDGSSTVTAKVYSFLGLDWGSDIVTVYDRLLISDTKTNAVTSAHTTSEPYLNLRLAWSPDSRHVVFSHGYSGQHGYITGGFVDAATGNTVLFPENEAFFALLQPLAPELSDGNVMGIEGMSHTVKTWNDDGTVTVDYTFRVGIIMAVMGTYRFDPASGEISEITCHISKF